MENLLEALNKMPIAVNFEFLPKWRFYKSGIINSKAPCGFKKNHSVLAVGYDLKDNFLRLKNSFGEKWGENGYF